jgi:predicted dehydrogenase
MITVDEAPAVYKELAKGGQALPLGVVIQYPDDTRELPEPPDSTRVTIRGYRPPIEGALNYVLVGAGAFGTAMLVPQMKKRRDRFFLRGVVSRGSAASNNFARDNQVEVFTTDYDEVLRDPRFDLVVISTRHDVHADQVVSAIAAGKHVFVEKPLAITWEQLERVVEAYQSAETPPHLLVGFNRRFSPALQMVKSAIEQRRAPLVVNYRLNAGYLPPDHWVHGPQGGGRNIGEACHMYDVFRFLTGSPVRAVSAQAIDPGTVPYFRNDNFAATVGYNDGSVCTLTYTSLGPKTGMGKEYIEIFCDGDAYVVDDFKRLTKASDGATLWSGETDKGHQEELSRFGDAIAGVAPPPITFDELVETSALALRIEDLLHGRVEE